MTLKQQIFVKEYIRTQNGAESVRKAGYNAKNPSHYANELLKKPKIAQEIDREYKKILDKYDYSEEQILKGIGQIAEDGKVEANQLRAWEIIAKIKGMTKDSTVNVSLFQSIDPAKLQKAKQSIAQRKRIKA